MNNIISMEYPEPEPECSIYYEIDPISYFIMFFGAGAGWFAMGYLLSDCMYNRGRSQDTNAILAERVN